MFIVHSGDICLFTFQGTKFFCSLRFFSALFKIEHFILMVSPLIRCGFYQSINLLDLDTSKKKYRSLLLFAAAVATSADFKNFDALNPIDIIICLHLPRVCVYISNQYHSRSNVKQVSRDENIREREAAKRRKEHIF